MYDYRKPSRELLLKPIMRDVSILKSNRNIRNFDIQDFPEFNIVNTYLNECVMQYNEYLVNLFEKFGVRKEDAMQRVIAQPNGNPNECDVYIDLMYAFTLKDETNCNSDGEHTTITRTVTPYRRNI